MVVDGCAGAAEKFEKISRGGGNCKRYLLMRQIIFGGRNGEGRSRSLRDDNQRGKSKNKGNSKNQGNSKNKGTCQCKSKKTNAPLCITGWGDEFSRAYRCLLHREGQGGRGGLAGVGWVVADDCDGCTGPRREW